MKRVRYGESEWVELSVATERRAALSTCQYIGRLRSPHRRAHRDRRLDEATSKTWNLTRSMARSNGRYQQRLDFTDRSIDAINKGLCVRSMNGLQQQLRSAQHTSQSLTPDPPLLKPGLLITSALHLPAHRLARRRRPRSKALLFALHSSRARAMIAPPL